MNAQEKRELAQKIRDENTARVNARTDQFHDTDAGLGIGGISNDQSMPVVPSVQAAARYERMLANATVCRRCGESSLDGAMFTTLSGSGICDDCAG
jgi:hypothetical protein